MAVHLLGPTLKATLCTADLARSIAAWQGSLHHHVHMEGSLSSERAMQLGAGKLAGARHAILANDLDEPWLELIENTTAEILNPFDHRGWFSLEISVSDVDQLRSTLDEALFRVIGEPANLDVSDDIRAMQLIGPAGEVLYLTQVKAAVPGFELPVARCPVDRLFIPVLLTENPDTTVRVYEQLNGQAGIKFDTRITVINQARRLDISQRHSVCILQLAGNNLIEFDQLDGLQPRPSADQLLPAGIVSITFAIATMPQRFPAGVVNISSDPGQTTACLRGPTGELIELIA